MRVLAVDDQPEVRDLLKRALERDGHDVTIATSLAGAEATLAEQSIDVIVLDLELPDGWGLQVCRSLRARGEGTPILILTAHSEVAERVTALDAGADDFLGKPFAVAELRARVRALGRRGPQSRHPILRRGEIMLDFAARRAERNSRAVPLTPREWGVLEMLAGLSGRIASRADILETVWGEASEANRASLDVIMVRIRRKLGESVVRTIRGEGYVLDAT